MASDDIPLSESLICTLADVRRQTRGRWADSGLLRRRARDEYTVRDLLDLVACKALIDVLGPTDGRGAWRQVRDAYSQQLPVGRLDVVFSEADHEAHLVTQDVELARAVRHGRPIRVIPLEREINRARNAFDRYKAGRVADAQATPAPTSAGQSTSSDTA
jgi:hypothetical protein